MTRWKTLEHHKTAKLALLFELVQAQVLEPIRIFMTKKPKEFQKPIRQKGVNMIEYALIIAVIAAAAIVIESALGQKAFSLIQGSANALDEVSQQL